jgi:hypothetical protein
VLLEADGAEFTCQVYVMEICRNRIRGGMVTFQAVWYASLCFLLSSLPIWPLILAL